MIELILSAIQAILQVMVLVAAGILFAHKGYIDHEKQKWLSKLNFIFFTPCLLFANIAPVISFQTLLAYWPIPIFFILFTCISWLLCRITLPLFKIGDDYKRFVTACVMFSNVNSLPVAIIASLAMSEAGKTLYWKPNDNQDTLAARGIAYTLFFGLFCNLLRWSLGYNLLQKPHTISTQYGTHDLESQQKSTSWSIDQYMSPPLYAACLALLVGLFPPIKAALYGSFVHGAFTVAIEHAGKTSVPITLFCLGAQLKTMHDTPMSEKYQRKPVFLSIALRMIVTPVFVLASVWLFQHFAGSKLAQDPVFAVSMVIVACTPTSINLAQITQVSGAYEEEMLHVLFWSYGVVCIPICSIVVFLALYIQSI